MGLPNGNHIRSTHTALLDIPSLPFAARKAHIFPQLKNGSLISIGQFCDHGCTATFDKSSVQIHQDGITIVQGHRITTNGLWTLNLESKINHNQEGQLPKPPGIQLHHLAYNAYETTTQRDLVRYLHQCCFSPTTSSWLAAIKAGFFATWPGLTCELVKKHLPKSDATVKGHLRQQYKNTRSTKPPPNDSRDAPQTTRNTNDKFLEATSNNSDDQTTRTNNVFLHAFQPTGQIYTDQTGRFPVTSSRGNKYIMLLYDYDSNSITTEPMKSRSEAEMIRAYSKLHDHLVQCGLKPQLQKLDNEAPAGLKKFMKTNGIDYQLVPPHLHRRNAAERAISTFKDHFIAGLASTDGRWPMHLWCRLLPQCTMTLNMLRASRLNPKLSAEAQLNGIFDFNRTPLAPPGTRVIIHEKPAVRQSWAPHGVDGWYLGPSLEHYRCYQVYANKTAHARVADTVEFFPEAVAMPKTSSADAAIHAAQKLSHALLHPHPAAPFATVGKPQLEAIAQLADIFATLTSKPITPQEPPRVVTPAPPRVVQTNASHHPNEPHLIPPDGPHRAITPSHDTEPVSIRPGRAAPPNLTLVPQPIPNHAPHRYNTRSRTQHNEATPNLDHHFANSVIDTATGQSCEYRHLISGNVTGHTKEIWETSFANELGRLAQGVGTRMPDGSNTIFFIAKQAVPQDRKPTYGRLVVSIRPQKKETHRTRLTVGGNLIEYPDNVSTPTADLTTAKILLNSVVSTPNAKFIVLDLKDFYLNTEMKRYEYMRMPITLIPKEIIDQYNLLPLVHDGYIYMEIRKGMYGLPQAGILANKKLTKHLEPYGYVPTKHTPGLWQHQTRPITFSLVVDDFGIKYTNTADANHLIAALKAEYECTTDWTGALYCGLTLQWDYLARTVDISMPGYVQAALTKFQHPVPPRPQHAPHEWNEATPLQGHGYAVLLDP